MGNNKRQRHETLAFPKIDMQHQDPPSRAPLVHDSDAFVGSLEYIGTLDIISWETNDIGDTQPPPAGVLVYKISYIIGHYTFDYFTKS